MSTMEIVETDAIRHLDFDDVCEWPACEKLVTWEGLPDCCGEPVLVCTEHKEEIVAWHAVRKATHTNCGRMTRVIDWVPTA